MLDLGTVRPGTTLYIPFQTFDSNDPSASVTLTGLATTDIEVYKDGSTTQRASDAGYALLDTDGIDFDTITGIHGFSIDLADNTTAGFYEAGSQYWVVVSSVTVDAATINFIAATFRIGYPDAFLNTTIATLSSQTSFTLEEGPADNDALNGARVIVHDLASAVQIAQAIVSDYVGSTKTVTLKADPGIFTMAAGDNISFFPSALVPTTAGTTLDVTATGAAGIDWANVENPTTAVDLSGTDIQLCDTTTTVTNSVTAGTVSDKTGYSLTQSFPTNFADLAITVTTGEVTVGTNNDKTGYTASTVSDKTGYSISGTKTTLDALNDVSAADVNTQCDTALSDIGLDHLISSALPVNWATDVAAGSVFDNIADDGTAAYDRTTDSLQAIADSGGGGPTAAQIADAVWDEAQADHVAAGSFGVTASEIADILVDTAEIGSAGAGLTAVPWNASWDAEVQSEVDDALVARDLHYLVNTALPTNWTTDVTANSVVDYMADDGTAVYDRTTDSLQAIADSGGGGPTAAQIADAVWDEAQADHVAAGSFGITATEIADILTDTADMQPKLGTPAGASISADIATVDSNVDAILVDTAEIGAAGAGLTAVPWNAAWDAQVESEVNDGLTAFWTSPATLVDLVWDETLTAHVTADSSAVHLKDILADTADIQPNYATSAAQTTAQNDLDLLTGTDGATLATSQPNYAASKAGDSMALTAAAVDAIWDETLTAHATADSAAVHLKDILADTNELQTDDIPATLAALNDVSTAEVLAQVNSALDAAISELGVAAPSATPSLRNAVMLLYMAARNKRTTTASADTISNNAGTTICTSTISDDGVTFTKGEYA